MCITWRSLHQSALCNMWVHKLICFFYTWITSGGNVMVTGESFIHMLLFSIILNLFCLRGLEINFSTPKTGHSVIVFGLLLLIVLTLCQKSHLWWFMVLIVIFWAIVPQQPLSSRHGLNSTITLLKRRVISALMFFTALFIHTHWSDVESNSTY